MVALFLEQVIPDSDYVGQEVRPAGILFGVLNPVPHSYLKWSSICRWYPTMYHHAEVKGRCSGIPDLFFGHYEGLYRKTQAQIQPEQDRRVENSQPEWFQDKT